MNENYETIIKNVKRIKAELANGNPFGEKVRLVAATKTRSAEEINVAIQAGVDAVAENRAQEFREKPNCLPPVLSISLDICRRIK
ncbi:MAG: hypothetical protein IJW58_03110 [Clostridia bacterium]|nr:hypothetical protein [Clostridia bacterium]